MRQLLHCLRYLVAVCAHHAGIDALYRRGSGPGLVVLMLHRLRADADPWPLSTAPDTLRQLLDWLRGRDALVGLDEGLQALEDGDGRTRYALTFDDGYLDNLGVLDMAGETGPVPAVVYVTTGHIGGAPLWIYRLQHAIATRTRDALDLGTLGLGTFDLGSAFDRARLHALLPPRLKELAPAALDASIDAITAQVRPASPAPATMLAWPDIHRLDVGGIEIGAHTRHHVLLSRADAATARDEILGSRLDLAARLPDAPAHFAYPNGTAADFGEREVRLVREAGFRTAATSIEGTNRPGVNPYRLLRHNVHDARYRAPGGALSAALFFSETSGVLGWLRARRAA